MVFKNLKGQIGIFVIISMIVVVLGVVAFSLNSDSIRIFSDEKSSYKVSEFIESCMVQVSADGVDKIGLNGGWLYKPSSLFFANLDKPKQYNKISSGIDYFGLEIPYWYYYDDSNEKFVSQIPDFSSSNEYSIQSQLKRYVVENLERNCIQKFKSFENIYDVDYRVEDMILNVDFDDENIIVNLEYPIQINEINSNNSEFIDEFEIEIENKLFVPYYLARDIVEQEIKSSFIEEKMISLIAPYQTSQNRDLLPPFYDYQIGYDFEPWKIENVEKLFKNIISSNIGLLQFLNTNYKVDGVFERYKGSEFANGISRVFLKSYLFESKTQKENPNIFEEFRDYSVSPKYESFMPTSFSIAPSAGDVILLPKPEAFVSFLPFFFTEYVAVYEVSMPILFEIENSKRKNDNFVFNLVVETNIDHNTPLAKNRYIGEDINAVDIDSDELLICDPTQRISGVVRLNISDPIPAGFDRKGNLKEVGVDDALVTFDCKGLASCYITQTKTNSKFEGNEYSYLEFRLPINCDPGKLEIFKFGRKKLVFDNLNPNLNEDINLGNNFMPSEKEFKLRFNMIGYNDDKFSNGKSLKDGESGFIIFESLEDSDYIKVIDFDSNTQYDSKISLVPGNYSVLGYVITENSFIIPEEQICYSKGLFSGDECQVIPEIKMDSWIRAGVDLSSFEVTLKDVVNNDKLIISLIDTGIPSNFDELEESSTIMADLKKSSNGKAPYFERK